MIGYPMLTYKSIGIEFPQLTRGLALAKSGIYIYKPINFALFQSVLSQTLDYWRSRLTSGNARSAIDTD